MNVADLSSRDRGRKGGGAGRRGCAGSAVRLD